MAARQSEFTYHRNAPGLKASVIGMSMIVLIAVAVWAAGWRRLNRQARNERSLVQS